MFTGTCEAVIEGNYKQYTESYKKFLNTNNLTGDIEEEGNHTKLILKGKSAHASTPEEGINAVVYLCKYLATVVDNKVVDFVLEYLDDCHGKKLGIDHTGLMGPLTLNLGVISFIKKKLKSFSTYVAQIMSFSEFIVCTSMFKFCNHCIKIHVMRAT